MSPEYCDRTVAQVEAIFKQLGVVMPFWYKVYIIDNALQRVAFSSLPFLQFFMTLPFVLSRMFPNVFASFYIDFITEGQDHFSQDD